MGYLLCYLFGALIGVFIACANFEPLNEKRIDCVIEKQEMKTEEIIKLCE